jgi:hypothetical protein
MFLGTSFAIQFSTSENIFSCKLIEHIFAYKTQQAFGAKKYVVARGDTLKRGGTVLQILAWYLVKPIERNTKRFAQGRGFSKFNSARLGLGGACRRKG